MTLRGARHHRATRIAAGEECMGCGAPPPSEPCHYPRHRGSGGRFADDWDPKLWVPLCRRCHDALDKRNGVLSYWAAEQTRRVTAMVELRQPAWLKRWS